MFNMISHRIIFNKRIYNRVIKSFSENLKKEFDEMLKANKISEAELKVKKEAEDKRIKEDLDNMNKEWDDKNKKLKKEWDEKRNIEEDRESENKLNHLKRKLKSAFYFNKSNKTEDHDNNNKNKTKKSKEVPEQEQVSKFSKFVTGFANVWRQTFPGEENIDLLMAKRKQEAIILKSKIKEATDEEAEEIEKNIPEWKRGAVLIIEDSIEQEKVSIFETAKRNLSTHIKNLKLYQDSQQSYENSELKLLMEDLKVSFTNVKENIKESQNPFMVVTRDLADRVSFKSPSSQVITVMRKFDPSFDLLIFEKEVNGIFKQLMTAFINDELDMIKLIAGETALAMLTSEIKSRRERVRHIYLIIEY